MSTNPPPWWPTRHGGGGTKGMARWYDELPAACRKAAQDAFPYEVCGMIVTTASDSVGSSSLRLELFSGEASSTSVIADPSEVVKFAYWLQQSGFAVLATFHSHPSGQTRFSTADEQLRLWARDHVVAVRRDELEPRWELMFA